MAKAILVKEFSANILSAEVKVVPVGKQNAGTEYVEFIYVDGDINPLMATANDEKMKVLFPSPAAIAMWKAVIAAGTTIPPLRAQQIEVTGLPVFVPKCIRDGVRKDGTTFKKGDLAKHKDGSLKKRDSMCVDIFLGGHTVENATEVVMNIITDKENFFLVAEEPAIAGAAPVVVEELAQ